MVTVEDRHLEVDVEADVERVREEWDELADRAGAVPFARPGWVTAWWRAFGSGALEIVTVRRGGRLAAAVAFRRFGRRVQSVTNYHTPEYALLAEDETAAAEAARAVFARAPRRVSVSYLDGEAPDAGQLAAAAAAAGYLVVPREPARSPYVRTDGEWAAYEAQVSPNLRGDVRRRRRRLAEQGTVEVEVASGETRLDALLEEGFGIEGSGWKAARGTAIASRRETRRFYADVARWAAERGWLRLAFLRLDGRAIAFHYNLDAQGVEYHLKGGYDPAFARFSPAKVLHYSLLERAFTADCRRYDFLDGHESYKHQFANAVRELHMFEAFAPSLSGRLDRAVWMKGRPLGKRALELTRRRSRT